MYSSELASLRSIHWKEKLEFLEKSPSVKNFLSKKRWPEFFSRCTSSQRLVCYSLIFLNQNQFFNDPDQVNVEELEKILWPTESFYSEMGGVIGYHNTCLALLEGATAEEEAFTPPEPEDISRWSERVATWTMQGLVHLPEMVELYPIGGAADRLGLQDKKTGSLQVAATLGFCGKTLLAWMIEDLQAREYLYYKIFGEQIRIPVGLMTSSEKQGDWFVRHILEEEQYFGRDPEDFFIFPQPLVPAMNATGHWCVTSEGYPLMKPGGHGVIWKLAKEKGFFSWAKKRGARKAFVRQINNPIAGVDYGLLAFMGLGHMRKKDFGFASCPRAKELSEGVNVIVDRRGKKALTNVEYCSKKVEKLEGKDYLANTNLLFIDLQVAQELTDQLPFPGLLVNAKKMQVKRENGIMEEKILRLESTMQNLADALDVSRAYISKNAREKTISSIKKAHLPGQSRLQTPEQCLIDFMRNAHELLALHCGFKVPPFSEEGEPSFYFHYHPALGPLYTIISQKLFAGSISEGSQLCLNIADLYIRDLIVDGALHIATDSVMGHTDEEGSLIYSSQTGKCTLKNVRVHNKGINWEATTSYWSKEVVYHQQCEIWIEEGGEFFAENIILEGGLSIHVPKGVRVIAKNSGGQLLFLKEPVDSSRQMWEYSDKEKARDFSLAFSKSFESP